MYVHKNNKETGARESLEQDISVALYLAAMIDSLALVLGSVTKGTLHLELLLLAVSGSAVLCLPFALQRLRGNF